MPGDYTRLTFDPRRDRAMMLEQQGRVHLDADFNELVAILDRRFRVETRDFAGAAVVPASLPDSFKLMLVGGKLAIAPGRMYVDGLLAENHGSGATVYDPVWGEPGGADPTLLGDQPYLGNSPPPIGFPDARLYFLDVWRREETWVEDSSLLEPALGVDTSSAVQTAWQVRWIGVDADATCSTDWGDDPTWISATQPSGALLTSQAVGVPAPTDPCAVAPVGGYRGLENRLYRVEIHDGGEGGAATLKWSRDNGAVASPITAIDTSGPNAVVTVSLLGRDSVLRFNTGDWVEVLDDGHEFGGLPGTIAQVTATDPTSNTLTLSVALVADAFDLTRNPRLRRWDQQNGLTDGVVPIPAALPATIDLEDGVQIVLDLAPASTAMPTPAFHTGDWWIFAARAASASVETLSAVPPRGIRHHYARLGIVDGKTITDCRIPFPGECECEGGGCECTACVTPESHASGSLTLQAAVDQVRPTGGRVCVEPGRYELADPLRVMDARSLTIVGAGAATLITYVGPARYGILVENGVEVSLERFALAVVGDARAGGAAAGPGENLGKAVDGTVAIALVNTLDARVDGCFVLCGYVPGADAKASFGAADVGIGLAGIAARTRLLENVILASTAIGDLVPGRSSLANLELGDGATPGVDADAFQSNVQLASYAAVKQPSPYLLSADLAIVDNLLLALRVGIDFGAATSARYSSAKQTPAPTINLLVTRIEDNLFLGCAIAGIVLLGLGGQESSPSQPVGGGGGGGIYYPPPGQGCTADEGARQSLTELTAGSATLITGAVSTGTNVGSDAIVVVGNVLFTNGDGIRATPDALIVRDNQITGASASSSRPTVGVLLAADRGSPAGRATLSGNWIRDYGYGGVVAAGVTGSLAVDGNRIIATGGAGVATLAIATANDVAVTGNTITDLTLGRDAEQPVRAVWLSRVDVGRVSGNTISRLSIDEPAGPYCVGIMVAGGENAEVGANILTGIGPARDHLNAVHGIAAQAVTTLDIHDNQVVIDPSKGTATDIPLWIGLLKDPQLVWVTGDVPQFGSAGDPDPVVGEAPRGRGDVGVHNNTLRAGGDAPLVQVITTSNITFSDNRCARGPVITPTSSLVELLSSASVIASANRVEGLNLKADKPAITIDAVVVDLDGTAAPSCTVLGNITDGMIWLNGTSLVAPWNALNIHA